jgi:hypothetical protein
VRIWTNGRAAAVASAVRRVSFAVLDIGRIPFFDRIVAGIWLQRTLTAHARSGGYRVLLDHLLNKISSRTFHPG